MGGQGKERAEEREREARAQCVGVREGKVRALRWVSQGRPWPRTIARQ